MSSQAETKADPPQDQVINDFINAMEKGASDEDLKNVFQKLTKDKITNASVSADVLCRVMGNFGLKRSNEKVEEIIRQVKADEEDENRINCDQLIKIINLLKEPTVVDQLTNIYGLLGREERIVLYGKSGVGKTWMAKKVADRAVRQGIFDIALWIYPNRDLKVKESVAYQLSIVLGSDESKAKEEGNDDKKEELENDKSEQEKFEKEKKKQEKLKRMIHAALKDRKVLLVFDGVQEESSLSKGSDFYKLLAMDQLKSHKVLRTGENEPSSDEIGIMVKPLSRYESISLVAGDGVPKDLAELFIDKIERLPSEVLIIAKTVRYFVQSKSGLQKLQSVKEKMLENESCSVIQLLINEYDLLPRSVLIDCYSSETSEKHFLNQGKIVNYNELISYWIMEGHLGQFDCIEDAYEKGHRVLMDLVDCGLLKNLEAGYVVSNGAKFHFDIHERYKFFGGIQLGLATTFDNKLGNIALADGMIRTIGSDQKGKKLLTLLLDGNSFAEVPHCFFESYSELENLAIFNPTHKPFPLPIFKMRNLRLLILRGCEFLESIERIFQWKDPEKKQVPKESQPETSVLQHSQSLPPPQTSSPVLSDSPHLKTRRIFQLTVLEISGPCPLKTIPDHVFKSMGELQNLNLSFLQIELFPGSFYHLTKLEILILRGCSSLKELGSLKNFKKLEVLDLSGSTSIENLHDKSFSENQQLQIIDLSQTRIEKLPLVHSNKNLKSLSLRDCPVLVRIRKIDSLRNLQVFNISGSTKVEEFLDPTLEDLQSCEVLDASLTSIKRLPFNIGNVRHLYLRECSLLKELTPFEAASKVEVLDLSSSSNLVDIKDVFLKSVIQLRELNLSKTGVKKLPSLSYLGKLRRLLLSHCVFLETLEQLGSLQELEVLDLSGCRALKEIEDKSFDNMKRLHTLQLSDIQLDRLPSLQNLTKLKELYVRDCPRLTNLPGLEELLVLEILDHSGTTLKPPPSFNHPDCRPLVIGSSLLSSNFDPQQLLKNLGCNEQPKEDDDGEKSNLPQEELDGCNWSISSWPRKASASEENLGVTVNGVHFIQLLKMYPSLLTKNFSQFHFWVFPTPAQIHPPDKAAQTHLQDKVAQIHLPDNVSYREELSLRDIYLGQVSPPKLDRCLEIRGFNHSPPLPQHLLEQAEFVVLIDNPFLRFLPDLFVDSIRTIKACWIERCNEMEHVLGENITDNLDLEILWVSDAMKLRSISSQNTQGISFRNLKSLYLEYCPQLSVICSSFLQLESLKILYIRYCQNLGTLFEDESARLDKLTKLSLWGLPELKKISCKLESLSHLRVGQCPLLEHVLSSAQGEEDEFEGHGKLKILQIKFCDKLKSIFGSQHEEVLPYLPELQELELWALPELRKIAFKAPSLQILKVGECPSLENVVDSGEVHENLLVLEVKSCDKVKTIIKGSGLTLGNLDKMELMSLPELKSIGADHFPCLNEENRMIYGCPKLQEPDWENNVQSTELQEIHEVPNN